MSDFQAPFYVKVGLLGIKTRGVAMAYLWICVGLAFGLTLIFSNPTALVFLLAALWYWVAIRWMDANDGWQAKQS